MVNDVAGGETARRGEKPRGGAGAWRRRTARAEMERGVVRGARGRRGLGARFYRAIPTLSADPLFSHVGYTRDTPQNWAREKRRPTSHSLMQESTMC